MLGLDKHTLVASVHSAPGRSGITGILSTAACIVQREGFLALYKGTLPALLKAALGTSTTFATHAYVSEQARA